MADQAKVASIDSLESFRNSLVIFMERVSKSIDEVGDTVRRTTGYKTNNTIIGSAKSAEESGN